MEHLSEVVWIADAAGACSWVSPSVRRVLGYDPAELLENPLAIVLPDHQVRIEAQLAAAVTRREPTITARAQVRAADGSTRWADVSTHLSWSPDGEYERSVTVLLDITEQVATEHRLAEVEERFRLVADNSSDALFSASADSVITQLSAAAGEVLGWEPDRLVGHRPDEFIHLDDREKLAASMALVGEGSTTQYRARWRAGNGEYRWVGFVVRPVLDADGLVVARVGSLHDVGREVEAEQAFLEARERLTAVLESTLEPHVQLEAVRDESGAIIDFIFTEANEAACDNLGKDRGEVLGARSSELLTGDHYCDILASYVSVVETGEPLVLENKQYVDAPDARRFDVRAVKVGDGVSLTWRDVTERYETAQALAATEQDFRLLAESIGDVVRVLDLTGIQTWVSPSVTKLLGYTPEELVGTYAQAIMHPDDFDRALATGIKVGMAGGTVTPARRTRVRHADGHWVWTETTNSFAYDADGNVTQIIAVTRDAEATVRAEAELRRMATTDSLTGLLNRACILDRLTAIVAEPSGAGSHTAVLFCDLDDLKTVNDQLGHAAGDAVIIAAAHRAAGQLADSDLIARFGGDELLVVLTDVKDLEDAAATAERLRRALSEPVPLPGSDREVAGSTSIGVALVRPGETADQVISRADHAMYEAKTGGRNRVVSVAW